MHPGPPTKYAPTSAVFAYLLTMSGYLRDLGEYTNGPFMLPSIPAKTQLAVEERAGGGIETAVRMKLRKINTSDKDTTTRLSRRYGEAFEMLKKLRDLAQTDPSSAEILAEKREYDFNEVLPGGKETITLAEMLNRVATANLTGAPCMNFLGGQLQDYIVELYNRPTRPTS